MDTSWTRRGAAGLAGLALLTFSVLAPVAASADPDHEGSPTPTSTATSFPSETASPRASAEHGTVTDTSGQGWKADPVSSKDAARMACSSLMFVGVRGSGETAPYGTTITGVRDALAKRWKGSGTVRQVWLDYPAADPHTLQDTPMSSLLLDPTFPRTQYFDSAREGAENLVNLLRQEEDRCPGEWVVLAGFSQGSQAITQALARTDVPRRLAGAILAGNPDHFPTQNVQEIDGTAPQSSIGMAALLYYLREQALANPDASRDDQVRALIATTIAIHGGNYNLATMREDLRRAKAKIPATAYPATFSVCQAGDPVCDAAPAIERILTLQSTWQDELNKGRPVHMGYTPEVMAQSLDAVAARMNAVGKAAAEGEPLPKGTTVTVRTSRWGAPQVAAVVGAGVGGLLIGALVGRLARRRRRH